VIELRPALIALVFLKVGAEDERIGPSLSSPDLRPVALLAMTSARDRWATSPDTYLGQPNIWTRHHLIEPQSGELQSSDGVDIVINDVAVLPGRSPDPNLARLEQGILDTLVEHVLAGETESLNTWERFNRREAEGMEWTVLRPSAPIDESIASALPSADLVRMRESLDDGDSVVVAAEPRLRGEEPFADWWRISADGSSLGMGYRGWGQDIPEEGDATVEISLKSLQPLLDLGRKAASTRHLVRLAGDVPIAVDAFAETMPIVDALLRVNGFLLF